MSNVPNDVSNQRAAVIPHDDTRRDAAHPRGDAGAQPAVPVNPVPDPIEESPFGSGRSSGRRRVIGSAIFAAVLLATIAAVYLLTRGGDEAAAAAGHNHGAAPAADSAMPVMLTAENARRIGVTYAPVVLGPLATEIRTVAQVTYDETRVKAIAPKIDGWVEELYVNYTGQPVQQGQALLSIYSPMLVTAQQELLLAGQLTTDVAGGTPDAQRGAAELRESARRRLGFWDIPTSEIDRIERTGEVRKTLVLRASAGGVVVEKNVLAGQRIMAGDALYRVADLSTVWLEGEVFERDLASVRLGQQVTAEFEALPGESRTGRITYTSPTLNAETRTARVRVELANPGLVLKPGMYATIRVSGTGPEAALSVPRSAVLATGTRTLVFVKRADGTLEPRDVVPGLATSERMQILQGLVEGDTVVASATFLVDAESNLGSALGGMGNMPGMDMGAPAGAEGDARPGTPVPPGTQPKAAPKAAPMPNMPGMKDMPGMDHSKHRE